MLVYDHGRGSNNRQTAFALGDESLHTSVVPELADNYYHATPHGCVLLVAPGPSPRTRLWDPRSGEIIALPAMERELEDNWRCYLSDAPTAPSCVVVVLLVDEPSFLYCRVGGSCWSAHEYDVGDVVLKPVPRRKRIIHELAAVDGKLYFKETGNMGVIDFSPATPEFSYLEKHQRTEFVDGSNICKEHLVESRGELFYVRIFLKGFTREIMAVRIYQIDLSGPTPTLRELEELGDRVFLLSYQTRSCCARRADTGSRGIGSTSYTMPPASWMGFACTCTTWTTRASRLCGGAQRSLLEILSGYCRLIRAAPANDKYASQAGTDSPIASIIDHVLTLFFLFLILIMKNNFVSIIPTIL